MASSERTRRAMKRSAINPVSAKRRGQLAERAATRREVFARSETCEAGINEYCSRVPTDVHEIKTRARGGSITDPDNCLALCRGCHRFITDHPAWSLEHGYVVHAWAGPADMAAAQRAREFWRMGIEVVQVDVEEDHN